MPKCNDEKRRLWRAYRTIRTTENKSLYERQSLLVKKLIYDHQKQVEKSVTDKANMGTFYRFVNGKLSCKGRWSRTAKNDCGELILDDTEKAERLNNYFMSVFAADDGNLPDFGRRVDESVLLIMLISRR